MTTEVCRENWKPRQERNNITRRDKGPSTEKEKESCGTKHGGRRDGSVFLRRKFYEESFRVGKNEGRSAEAATSEPVGSRRKTMVFFVESINVCEDEWWLCQCVRVEGETGRLEAPSAPLPLSDGVAHVVRKSQRNKTCKPQRHGALFTGPACGWQGGGSDLLAGFAKVGLLSPVLRVAFPASRDSISGGCELTSATEGFECGGRFFFWLLGTLGEDESFY